MGKHYETVLPDGYEKVLEINAKEKKTGLWMNAVGLLIFIVALAPFVLDLFVWHPYRAARLFSFSIGLTELIVFYAVFFGGFIAYLVLHELTHGLVYKQLTKQKLTFGITWSAAYCGVPHIYVYRKAALLAILAPFVLFTLVFFGLLLEAWLEFVSEGGVWGAVYAGLVLLFASHMAGCVGDLYGAALMLFRFRDKRMLMNDTGPMQTFWLPKETEK